MDLDGDGLVDLISGSWPGELFFFKGGAGNSFAPPVKLKDKDGKVINVGGGIKKEADGSILITGDAKFEQDKDGNSIVTYNGETFKSNEGKSVMVTGCASAVHACDWNGDGKLDLLVGEIGGSVHLYLNEARDKGYLFGKSTLLKADGKDLRVEGDAGPFVADWDGDGKADLLVGSADGSVAFYRNMGTQKEPKLEKAVHLIPAAKDIWGNPPAEPTPGVRTKLCVYDWNGDGKLDLLVGDYTMLKPKLPEFTKEEKAEQEKLRKEQNELMSKRSKLFEKMHGPERVKDVAELKKVSEELKKVMERYMQIHQKLPQESESHGFVWLYLRK